MRFGNIVYNKRNRRMNLGDDMQLLAVENLFRIMKVDYNDVVRIELSDLYSWEGEELVVPISFPFNSYNDKMHVTCFSEKIHPVFLALSILTDTLDGDDVSYLKRFSPIGCRDYHTLCTMKKYDIDAYLFGCMTQVFPRRWKPDKNTQVFCFDVSEELAAQIPPEIKKNCCFLTNAYNVEEIHKSPEEKEREIYEMLINEAKLVITSRMHIASPCIAAGIPVIFAVDLYSYRFTGIDRLIKVYPKEEYSQINWNPEPLEYEELKEKMLHLAMSRVYNKTDEYTKLIEEFNECMKTKSMHGGIIESVRSTEEWLQDRFSYDDNFDYIVWSVTQTAEVIYNLLTRKWENARMTAVVDKRKKVNFHGINSTTKEIILENKNALVLVCSDAAIGEAEEFLKENGIRDYFYCCRNGMPIK